MHAAKQGEQGLLQAGRLGKTHFFLLRAAFAQQRPARARHDVRAIAHAIDGARYDLHGLGTLRGRGLLSSRRIIVRVSFQC